jgi:hypothetical protein
LNQIRIRFSVDYSRNALSYHTVKQIVYCQVECKMATRMRRSDNDYFTETKTVGTTRVLIEMTRFGLLWHGNAARLTPANQVERSALAVAWGADRNQVYQDVMRNVTQLVD